ncbi:hypothetical protein OIE68_45250 [Nocardia vinacea]|uniref:hypothetical protein n=1 Tax=Nocardia vinacea TaxID=96468 RepID=UPI002E1123FC|nr:hypothetical protein OIE68_45250 [Nocardia vinacea]
MKIDFSGLYSSTRRATGAPTIPFEFPPTVAPTPLIDMHCATTSIDARGRLGERSTIRALGWLPGQPIAIESDECVAVVTATSESRWSIGPTGYLHLPAAIRHACTLSTGDRALVVSVPRREALVVYPMPSLATALFSHRPTIWVLGDET